MNPLQELSEYLRKLERNLRLWTFARGAAVLFGAALLVTLLLVLIMNRLSFSDPSVFYSRMGLFFILAAALGTALIWPLLRLNQKRVARMAERRNPEMNERLITFVERRGSNDAFLPLLAADALPFAAASSAQTIAAPSRSMAFGTLALLSGFLLLWLGLNGPGYFQYGTSLLWGLSKDDSKPFYSISLDPGNHRVRRHADQPVAAHLNGFFSRQASLFVRYASATRWEETPMRPERDGAGFQFVLVGIPEDLEYYVVSNGIHSKTAKLTAVDLPSITHLTTIYHYPKIYGMADQSEDPGGDLRAIQGTVATLSITTDKALPAGFVVLDDGRKIELTGSGATHQVNVPIEKDGAYHIATPDSGDMVRLSDDYFIEARPDSAPTITIRKPGRDARVTPIEELPVELEARDDNGVLGLDLHYSVNGGPDQVRSLLSAKGAKEAKGTSLLSLEDFKLVPGDIVSLYAAARDAKTTAKSDIYFVEARPFELNYHQEQASGGNGDQPDQPKMAERQKEIIAATFNQLKSEKHDGASAAENAKYLAGVQAKLKDEAQSLSNRMKARQLESSGAEMQQFVASMQSAIEMMAPAAEDLKGQKWNDALSPEQKALQYLLRAESIFRDIQVVMSRGGGGGGGGGASRDLEGLTSLELDTQKNQYESGSQSAADQKQKEADDALKKLEELARRQQELAQQQQSKQNFQQRWEQEILRREAEQLRQKLQELAKNQQQDSQQQQGQQSQSSDSQSSQGQSSQSQSSQSQSQGQSSQGQSSQGQSASGQKSSQQDAKARQNSGQQAQQPQSGQRRNGRLDAGTQQALEKAIQNLTEAERSMGDAASHGNQSQASQAADKLNRAEGDLSGMRREQNGSDMSRLQDDARKLADKQTGFDERLRHNFAGGASENRSEQQTAQLSSRMADEKRREIDDLHELEHQLQQTARGMQNTQPDAAKKLRDAIGQMQQNELESRMKWTVDALNKGLGSYAVMREAPVTQALNQLRDQLGDAESAMKNGAGKQDENGAALEQALARAEKLRKDLQAMAGKEPGQGNSPGQSKGKDAAGQSGVQPGQQQGKPGSGQKPGGEHAGNQPGNSGSGQKPGGEQAGNQPGNQPGNAQGQSGSPSQASGGSAGSFGASEGQQGSQSGGSQPGRNTSPQMGGASSGGWDAMNFGGGPPPDAATVTRSFDEAARELGRLQQSVRSDAGTAKQIQDLVRQLQTLDPRRFRADPGKLAALEQQILATAEEAELVLRRKVEDQQGNIRTMEPQNVPPGYANAVAEYFRKLSAKP